MNFRHCLYISLLAFCFGLNAFSQVTPEKDTTNVYKKIEDYSNKRKSTQFLHKLLFKSTTKKPKRKAVKVKKQNLKPYQGKIIRNISITTHDPFGYSFTDTTETANSFVEKTGNFIHVRSKQFTIQNLMLIKKNTVLDTLLLRESERLIRSQNYIRSVQLNIKRTAQKSDSIDIIINVLDSWSLIPNISVSTSKNKLGIKERNFLGLGHQLDNSITNRLSDGKNAYSLQYTIPNFKNTFINTSLGYRINLDGHYSKYLDVKRPLYSPFASWAGGIYLDEQFRQEFFEEELPENNLQNFKYLTQDVWGAHSFQLFKGDSEKERTTNLISGLRLLHLDFKESPIRAIDSVSFFSNETFVMGSVGIASRQFVQDNYIFQDGFIEDVPVGTIYAITTGVQHKNQKDRLYLGARISHGNYYSFGYLSTNFEYGTFVRNKKTEQTAYSFQANYFTNLISLGDKWKMRQFVKPQFLIGTNRLNSIGDRLTISENNRFQGVYGSEDQQSNSVGIQGFNGDNTGTKKYVLSLQTQFYSPWEVLGFRLNPYLNYSAAMLGNEGTSISKSKLYSSFGVGFIIRNDYLVFSSFQLSLSYYPTIPGQGDNIIKTNSFETDDFGFQNFELGKPRPVWYN